MHTLHIHISAFGDEQFDDFLVTFQSHQMQSSAVQTDPSCFFRYALWCLTNKSRSFSHVRM